LRELILGLRRSERGFGCGDRGARFGGNSSIEQRGVRWGYGCEDLAARDLIASFDFNALQASSDGRGDNEDIADADASFINHLAHDKAAIDLHCFHHLRARPGEPDKRKRQERARAGPNPLRQSEL
jgi:hypothetical protein